MKALKDSLRISISWTKNGSALVLFMHSAKKLVGLEISRRFTALKPSVAIISWSKATFLEVELYTFYL